MIQLLIFLFSSLCYSQSIDTKFIDANKLYQSANYEEAIVIYEDLINNNVVSFEIYYNLANSYYRIENIGHAIYNYHKALKIDPDNEDAKFNLELTKLKTIDKFDEIPDFFLDNISFTISNWFNEKTWTFISTFIFIIALVLIALFYNSRDLFSKKLFLNFSIIFSVLFVLSFYFANKQSSYQHSMTNGVIISPSAYIKSEPDQQSTDILILHEGATFDLIKEERNWNQVKLADGNIGWIYSDNVLLY